MKNIILKILGVFFLTGLFSCEDVFLDKEPIDMISDAVVWEDERLVEAYLDEVLHDMYFNLNECVRPGRTAHIGWEVWDVMTLTQVSDEARHSKVWRNEHKKWGKGIIDERGGGFQQLWAYPEIRRCNEIIGKMENSSLGDDAKLSLTTKARWARAMIYFAMVKRFGGIPLITEAQSVDAPEDELFQPRAKEVDVYDFIISEVDAIAENMPDVERQGYPSKWAAYALKSRAALFAASIASFGTVQLDGVLGIPASGAQRFWQASYDASKKIIDEGDFALYNKFPDDKVKNYRQVFLDESDNPESIFALSFNGKEQEGFNHGWDNMTFPAGYSLWGATLCVYLDMVEAFDNVDGTPGTFDRAKYEGGLWTAEELFANKEPRFHATILTQGSAWQGNSIDMYTHLILPDGSEISGGNSSYEGVLASGLSSKEGSGVTGFNAIKYSDESNIMPGRKSSEQDYMVFRYAEMLLNCAEAAIELNKPEEALTYINQIRERAGVALISSADRDAVRHERKIELSFEAHSWFDQRRWRTAVDAISRPFKALNYKLDYNSVDDGAPKYLITVVDGVDGNNQKDFPEKLYYLPITPNRISNNPKMVENPGY